MYKCQYDFKENHFTVLALLEFIENVIQQLESNMITLSVFIDLQTPLTLSTIQFY